MGLCKWPAACAVMIGIERKLASVRSYIADGAERCCSDDGGRAENAVRQSRKRPAESRSGKRTPSAWVLHCRISHRGVLGGADHKRNREIIKWHGSQPWGVRMDRLGNGTEGESHSRMSGQACEIVLDRSGGRGKGPRIGWQGGQSLG